MQKGSYPEFNDLVKTIGEVTLDSQFNKTGTNGVNVMYHKLYNLSCLLYNKFLNNEMKYKLLNIWKAK